ncbi:uncharacterized protein PHACADRAFT_58748, partial [Phanerochaete carnosa HHB-10118-sp]
KGNYSWGSDGYSTTSSGTNSQVNHYCHRDGRSSSSGYHYSNSDGSYYYNNLNGSMYYDSGNRYLQYTLP